MATKNVSLPVDLDRYIDAKVASGEYAHASEVVREGLRLLMRQEADKLEWLKNAIAEGIASAEVDEGMEFDDAMMERIKARGLAMVAAKRAMG